MMTGRSYAAYQVHAVECEDERRIACAVVSFHDQRREISSGQPPLLHAAAHVPTPTKISSSRTIGSGGSLDWPDCAASDDTGLRWSLGWDGDQFGVLGDATRRAAALAFLSDLRFIWAAYARHHETHDVAMVTSLDHAVFFHHADDPMEEATLPTISYEMDSTFAGGGRGLVRGQMFEERSGRLLATTIQEGVLRVSPRCVEETAGSGSGTRSRL